MKVIKPALEWTFGVFLGITALLNIYSYFTYGGLLMLVSGFILIPPIFGIIQSKIPILNRIKYLIIVTLNLIGFFVANFQMMNENHREMERNEFKNSNH